ncbi:Pol protein [Phytophthora palmivora]|uniref:Pol protein n=1 Tax=Phytophthora palmivora TaxID=4796 RepID=A0A2P4X0Z1_9STRA|nr:Pol protein [Phytophthora palmivora]
MFEQVGGMVKADGNMTVKFRFMDLNYGSRISHQFAVINNTKDEMVLGRDILNALGTIVNFRDGIMEWNGNAKLPEVEFQEELKEINDTSVKPEEMIRDAEIDSGIYQQVVKLLTYFETLYNGHLGRMKLPDYVLAESYTPINARPYSVPGSEEDTAQAKWKTTAADGFSMVEQVYDAKSILCALIRAVFIRLEGVTYFSLLNANMGYYARQLAKQCRKYTAFWYPFRKFQYKRLPMGISTASDEYRACMSKILGDLDFVIVYLDDILIFSKTAEDHAEH